MDLEYIIDKGYSEPDETDREYKKFMNDNKFKDKLGIKIIYDKCVTFISILQILYVFYMHCNTSIAPLTMRMVIQHIFIES